jgi:hypothetical protein
VCLCVCVFVCLCVCVFVFVRLRDCVFGSLARRLLMSFGPTWLADNSGARNATRTKTSQNFLQQNLHQINYPTALTGSTLLWQADAES